MEQPIQQAEQEVIIAGAISSIRSSFCLESFDPDFIDQISALVTGDISFDLAEVARRSWKVIVSDDSSGQLNTESEVLVQWWKQEGISPVYATSLNRLKKGKVEAAIVMRLVDPDFWVLNQIQGGMWMFGEGVPDLAQQRIADWREDVYFSCPLRFVVLSIYDGDGGSAIAGPPELIRRVLAAAKNKFTQDQISWKELL